MQKNTTRHLILLDDTTKIPDESVYCKYFCAEEEDRIWFSCFHLLYKKINAKLGGL